MEEHKCECGGNCEDVKKESNEETDKNENDTLKGIPSRAQASEEEVEVFEFTLQAVVR